MEIVETVVLRLEKYDKLKDDLLATQDALNTEMEENIRLAQKVTKLEGYVINQLIATFDYKFKEITSIDEIFKLEYPGKFIKETCITYEIDIELVYAAFQNAFNNFKEKNKTAE